MAKFDTISHINKLCEKNYTVLKVIEKSLGSLGENEKKMVTEAIEFGCQCISARYFIPVKEGEKCPKCGSVLIHIDNYCPYCGTGIYDPKTIEVENMFGGH